MSFRTEAEIIERITQLREEHGIQKKQVAEALGVDPSAITRLEAGQRGLAAAELATIADLLGVSTDELLRDDVAVMVLRADASDEKVATAMVVVDNLVSTYRYLDAIAGTP